MYHSLGPVVKVTTALTKREHVFQADWAFWFGNGSKCLIQEQLDSLIEQHVVLRTHPQVLADVVHVGADVVSVDERRARRGREQASKYRPVEKRSWHVSTMGVQTLTTIPQQISNNMDPRPWSSSSSSSPWNAGVISFRDYPFNMRCFRQT